MLGFFIKNGSDWNAEAFDDRRGDLGATFMFGTKFVNTCTGLQEVALNELIFAVHQPVFADAVLGVIMHFDTSIHGFRAWRKNFDDKVRCRKFHQGGLDIGRTEAFEKGDVWLEIIAC